MIIEVKVPSPGESINEVQLATWLVENNQHVEKDQEIVEIDSDKATLAVAAEASGKIELLAHEGDTLEVGAVIARIDTAAEGTSKEKNKKSPVTTKPSDTGETKKDDDKGEKGIKEVSSSQNVQNEKTELIISPVARKIMSENNISEKDLFDFFKTLRFGKKDIEYYLENGNNKNSAQQIHPLKREDSRQSKRQKMSLLRKKLAQRLVSVKNETAMLTTFNEVNMTPIIEIRKKYKTIFEERHGIGLGFVSFFTKAVTEAIAFFPQVNSQIDGDEIVTFDYVDVSIAVSAPKGLVVPVVRNAQTLTLAEIERKIKELANKARENRITLDDMQGGTFTITNGGVFGSMMSTPIINPPQSAILGMHNIVERPVAVNGKVEIHPMMYIALSYDHRIIDGRESVGFLVKVKEMLENPERMLFGGKNPVEKLLGL
jgi:2-oxoglutarate dehydrogenase E2 component (dihydrolipoamide succinyltransferase)